MLPEPSIVTGTGTAKDPYLISSTEQWNFLVEHLNQGRADNDYSGKYFKLADNIAVGTMMGNDSHPFRGTFDGDGHKVVLLMGLFEPIDHSGAMFYQLDGATIKNLLIHGWVYSYEPP